MQVRSKETEPVHLQKKQENVKMERREKRKKKREKVYMSNTNKKQTNNNYCLKQKHISQGASFR